MGMSAAPLRVHCRVIGLLRANDQLCAPFHRSTRPLGESTSSFPGFLTLWTRPSGPLHPPCPRSALPPALPLCPPRSAVGSSGGRRRTAQYEVGGGRPASAQRPPPLHAPAPGRRQSGPTRAQGSASKKWRPIFGLNGSGMAPYPGPASPPPRRPGCQSHCRL